MAEMKKILITGAGGLLGSEFQEISKKGHPEFKIIPIKRDQLDITDLDQVSSVFSELNPDIVINCAGYTNVDAAELERELAWRLNVEGPRLLAEVCRATATKLVHYSSNSVFDGEKMTPYLESDTPSPIGFYGNTKLEGERVIQSILSKTDSLILRITWPYGRNGNNFINNILKNLDRYSAENVELRAVTDQIGTPNPAKLLASNTLALLEAETSGTFHLSCLGSCSKFEFISCLLSYVDLECRVVAATTQDFPSPAKRPRNSSLASEREEIQKILKLPSWQDALREYLNTDLILRLQS